MTTAFVSTAQLVLSDDGQDRRGYPWDLPAIAALSTPLHLDPRVTYLVGENGSGKSTLLEAIAVAAGMNPEGGSSNYSFSTRDSHSGQWKAMRLTRGAQRPRTDFFLRAESLFTAATYLDEPAREDARALDSPLILAYPESTIYVCTDAGLERTDYEQAEPVRLTRSFLDSKDRFLQQLFAD